MKKIFGGLAVLLGFVGMAACLAGIAAAFIYADAVDDASAETLRSVENSLIYVDKRVALADSAVTTAKHRIGKASALITKVLREGQKNPKDYPQIKALEAEVKQYSETALATMETIADGAEALAKWLELLDKLPLRESDASTSSAVILKDSKELAAQLHQLSALLKTLQNRIAEFKKGVDTQDLATAIEDTASKLINGLENVHGRVASFAGQIDELENDVDTLQEKLPVWIATGKYVAAIVLFWMAIGQLCLLLRGVTMIRRTDGAEPAE